MNAGMFKHPILLLKPEIIKDDLGQEDIQWTEFKTLWAAIKTMQGREYFAAAATHSENTSRFIVRYTEDIDSSMKFLFKGKTHEIISVINDDEANKTLTIIAKEGGQSG
jgi:SPP1 family predicted phage head-tail adaptor